MTAYSQILFSVEEKMTLYIHKHISSTTEIWYMNTDRQADCHM
jgi:hypothetical protein